MDLDKDNESILDKTSEDDVNGGRGDENMP